jgi:hypothetical protein
MDNSTTTTPTQNKRVVMIHKSGPAFSPGDFAAAHTELDLAGAPRELDGQPLSIRSRIAFLRGEIEALRALAGVGERQ